MANWRDFRFFAHKKDGRIMFVSRTPRLNGTCFEALVTSPHDEHEIPVATWVDPTLHAKRYYEVSEAKAREMRPMLFQVYELYERSAAYRNAHGRYQGTLQRADDRCTGKTTIEAVISK